MYALDVIIRFMYAFAVIIRFSLLLFIVLLLFFHVHFHLLFIIVLPFFVVHFQIYDILKRYCILYLFNKKVSIHGQ